MLSYSGTTGKLPSRKVVGTGSRGAVRNPPDAPVARYGQWRGMIEEGSRALAL